MAIIIGIVPAISFDAVKYFPGGDFHPVILGNLSDYIEFTLYATANINIIL